MVREGAQVLVEKHDLVGDRVREATPAQVDAVGPDHPRLDRLDRERSVPSRGVPAAPASETSAPAATERSKRKRRSASRPGVRFGGFFGGSVDLRGGPSGKGRIVFRSAPIPGFVEHEFRRYLDGPPLLQVRPPAVRAMRLRAAGESTRTRAKGGAQAWTAGPDRAILDAVTTRGGDGISCARAHCDGTPNVEGRQVRSRKGGSSCVPQLLVSGRS